MSRRIPDSLAHFRLLEACRFGGDTLTALETLKSYAFDADTLRNALTTLRAGVAPDSKDARTLQLETALERRLKAAATRESKG